MALLYRYESKGIQSWILASNQLRDLVGGSALIENLTTAAEELARKAGATRIIQATSGAMTAEFPDEEALQRFAGVWPLAVSQRAPGLTVVQAWVSDEDGMRALFAKLAVRRNRASLQGVEAGPWVLRTGRSGAPAVPTPASIRSVARQTALDAAAVVKEVAYKRALATPGVVTGGRTWAEFQAEVDQWPEAPVAVIHADGSGIGQALIALGSDPEKLQQFSMALREVTTEAIQRAVETLPENAKGLRRARPVVSAGDDLTYIVPGGSARAFCLAWLQAFEAGAAGRVDRLGGPLTAGAGVAIVHRHHPFSQAYEMAEALCAAAKARVATSSEATSVLAFKRVTTSLEEDVTEHAVAWRVPREGGLASLTGLISAVRDLPRGTFRTWLSAFESGDDAYARHLWARAREVAKPDKWAAFEQALRAAGADPETGALSGTAVALAVAGGGRTTPVHDALIFARLEGGSV